MNYEILAIDDHPVVLEGIKKIASMCSNTSCDGITEVEMLETCFSSRSPYDMYILDLEFPKADGFSILQTLRERTLNSRILIYTMHEEPWVLANLIDADIDGLVSKNADFSELQKAINTLRGGDTYFNETFLEMIKNGKEFYVGREKEGPKLSDRERSVLLYICKGFNNKEIADMIFLSTDTIKTYRKRLMLKFGAKNAVDLAFKGKDFI